MADEDGKKTLQDIMSGELFSSGSKGEMVEALKFMEAHGTPLSEHQAAAVALLRVRQAARGHKDYEPIIKTMQDMAKQITGPKIFLDTIREITLGGMVQGKIRASKMFAGGDR